MADSLIGRARGKVLSFLQAVPSKMTTASRKSFRFLKHPITTLAIFIVLLFFLMSLTLSLAKPSQTIIHQTIPQTSPSILGTSSAPSSPKVSSSPSPIVRTSPITALPKHSFLPPPTPTSFCRVHHRVCVVPKK